VSERRGGTSNRWAILLLAGAIALLPAFLPNSFYFDLAIKAMLNALVCIGLNLMIGYAGQISLGHAAFFAIGGYASAALVAGAGLPAPLALVAGAGMSALVAFVVGRPILRLKGHYLAMATLGFGIILHTVFMRETGLTGGPDGRIVPAFAVGALRLTRLEHWYWLVGGALVLGVVVARLLVDSAFGRALRGLHDAEAAVSAVGVDVAAIKVRVFVISAVYASVAGSLFAHVERFITPGESGFIRSIEFVTMVVLGGMASTFGAIAGAAVLTVLTQVSATFADYKHIVLGTILVFTMAVMPAGIVPPLARTFSRRK